VDNVWADIILVLHALFIAFVILSFILIVIGIVRRWQWTRNFWFRAANLLAIGLVAVNAWVGKICPLTILENEMRGRAGSDAYPGTFVGYYLQKVIYYDFPIWVFAIVYTVFAALVLITWIIWPPRWPHCNSGKDR
jgi:polyferredoxin